MTTISPRHTVSVIIPALNEENNIAAAVTTVLEAIGDRLADYELLIFDDGSTDGTGKIADELAGGNPHIRVIHNPGNKGFGYNYKRGVELARMEYVTWFPGDNDAHGEGLRTVLGYAGSAEIVVTYLSNPQVRSWIRRLISGSYVGLLNLLFGLRLRYYNGLFLYPRALLRSIPLQSKGFACLASSLIRLIRSGHSYIEVPYQTGTRRHGCSKAFRLKNLVSVFITIAGLFWDVRVRDRRKYPGVVQQRQPLREGIFRRKPRARLRGLRP